MGNNGVNTSGPLLSPQQLWNKPTPKAPTQLPGTIPTQLPGTIPPVSPQTTVPTYTAPVDTLPSLPPQGTSAPQLPFTTQTTQTTPSAGSVSQLNQLTQLFRSGDDSLLGKYGVQLAKDPQGQITGYFVNGQSVTGPQLQQHLLPHASFLHQELENLKTNVDQSYGSVHSSMQQAYTQMTPAEQQSISIQMQAVHVVYESFVNRLNQIDGLIR